MSKYRYYIIYKPYGMLSQFQDEQQRDTLKSLANFPQDVYPVGRLDRDSEGLLILTNDTRINNRLLNPKHKHWREYYVQVEGEVTQEAIKYLTKGGLAIKVSKKQYITLPAKAQPIPPPDLPDRIPPIRYRKEIPTSWISLQLVEGKNRQVRKMTAKVGFPTLRLVRVAIAELKLGAMQVGEVQEVSEKVIYKTLFG